MVKKNTRNSVGVASPSTPNAGAGAKNDSKEKSESTLSQMSEKVVKLEEEIKRVRDFADAQANHIVLLEEKYVALEERLEKNERVRERDFSIAVLKDRVISELRDQLNKLQQFTRRPCVSIVGLKKARDEKFSDLKEEVQSLISKTDGSVTFQDVDKFHRDGPLHGPNQDVIVRFRSHAAKEAFYKKRKDIAGENEHLKIRPSLTDATRRLLKETNEAKGEFSGLRNPPEFVLPDVHGNLMIKMKNKSRLGLFVKFHNMDSFRSKIYLAQDSKADDEFNCYDISDDEDGDTRSAVSS